MQKNWLLRWAWSKDDSPAISIPDPSGRPTAGWRHRESRRGFFDGYLFDRIELISELGLTADASPAEIGLGAYDRWGSRLFDRLRGGFMLIIWDQDRRQLVAGRDALGLHPAYYRFDGELLLLSSHVEILLDQPEVARRPNREALAEFLISSPTRHQIQETLYAEISRLPPARYLTLSGGDLQVRPYWEPLPPGFSWAGEEERRQLVSTLERAVKRCLTAGAESIALSGGFDSVSLAVLASAQRDSTVPLEAISMRFPSGVCDEGAVQTAVAGALDMPQRIKTIDESLMGKNPVTGALEASAVVPCPVLSPWQSMYTGLFRSARKPGGRQILIGTGGDDFFSVDCAYGADCLRNLRFRTLWRFFRSWQRSSPFGVMPVARKVLWNRAFKPVARYGVSSILSRLAPGWRDRIRDRRADRAFPAWLRSPDSSLRDRLIERKLSESRPAEVGSERWYINAMRSLTLRPLLMLELEQAFSWGRWLGSTFFYPYFDRDLVELALRFHPEHLIAGGRSKAPLRRLVAERLPTVALPSKKVEFSRMVHQVLRLHGPELWKTQRASLRLEAAALVEADQLVPVIDGYLAGENDDWITAWLILSTEMWLQEQGFSG